MINKGILKFPKKKEVMVINEDPFPLVASINIVATYLRAMLNSKKAMRFLPSAMIRNVWIPKQYLVHMDDLATWRSVWSQRKEKE